MKKCFSNIRTLAALLMAGAAFAACSSDDNSIEQSANPTAPKTYTLTVNASKGDASTRALALDGTALVAKWAEGDELSVFKAENRTGCTPANSLGTISVVAGSISANGDQATFTGNLTGTVSNDDILMLVYHPAAFAIAGFEGQAGTLASASNLDCATAQVTASVSGSDITIKETSATFTTHTAMLKLTLTKDGTTTINPTELKMTMTSGTTPLYEFTFKPTDATYNANGNGVLYFALPSAADVAAGLSTTTDVLNGVTITYAATVGSDTYTATKTTGYTFAAGKYYAGTLTMANKEVNLSSSSPDVTVPAGEHWLIKGYAEDICVTIGDGATVTLNGVEFYMSDPKPCIKCSGDATIILADGTTNTLTVDYGCGIQAGPSGKTLTIKGNTGVLNVEINHTGDATAIGAYDGTACGDIVIEGGVINATSQNGAAIGACYQASCGNITISGGTVTAKAGGAGDCSGVGIGGHYDTACGNIKITGGTVTATGFKEPGIGGDNICGDITISGGTVKATKGGLADMCIGIGNSGTCGTITIGGTVYWDGSNYQNGGDTYLTQSTITYPAP